jgi:hypothetical protein
MNLNFVYVLFFHLVLLNNSRAQALLSPASAFHGRIIDDSTRQSVAYSHLFNESKRIGAISDETGTFKIMAKQGDTIIFSAVGYLHKVVVLSDSCKGNNNLITLTPVFYDIEEVSVVAYGDYEDFKKAFLQLELPVTQTKILRNYLAELSVEAGKLGDEEGPVRRQQLQPEIITGPSTVPIYSREDLQRMNLQKVLNMEARQRVIEKKYNRQIIYEVTKLPEDEITDFMGFCNFSESFLYEASPYEILVKIEEKFNAYKLSKGSGDLISDPEFTCSPPVA